MSTYHAIIEFEAANDAEARALARKLAHGDLPKPAEDLGVLYRLEKSSTHFVKVLLDSTQLVAAGGEE